MQSFKRKAQQSGPWLRLCLPLAVLAGLAMIEVIPWGVAVGLAVSLVPLVLWIGSQLQAQRYNFARPILTEGQEPASAAQLSNISRMIMEGMPDALLLIDKDRRVIEANPVAERLFGNRLRRRDVLQVIRHPAAVKTVEKALGSRRTEQQEISMLNPGERHFLMNIVPLQDQTVEQLFGAEAEDGRGVPGAFLSLHEITAIKQSEDMRADFVANASHELRTPLASLIGFIETLQGPAKEDGEARDRFLDIMARESQRMQRLIDDLLSLSRIELDEHVLPTEEADLNEVLEEVSKAAELRAQERGMAIRLDLPQELPSLLGDEDQLVQVFLNLVDNAIKYAAEDTEVLLRAEPVKRMPESGREGMRIQVIDHGQGIPREHLPRLTDRFYRVDSGRSREMGSTGLGLAIVKHIVKRHRGVLNFESEIDVGTTVSVTLPVHPNL